MQESSLDYVLNFQRHEWKYFLPTRTIQALIPEIMMFMDMDAYSKKNGFYDLYSVYYDTEDWQSFYEKIDGIERRKKFRIRSYKKDVSPEDEVFLEVKEKNKDIILKRRRPIKMRDVNKLNSGSLVSDDSVLEEWRYNIVRNAIKPRIMIGYKRMAFVPRDNVNLRITIDTEVGYSMLNHRRVDFSDFARKTYFSREFSVLEIKYSGPVPKFVEDLIRRHNLRNEAISKFSDSVMSFYKVIT